PMTTSGPTMQNGPISTLSPSSARGSTTAVDAILRDIYATLSTFTLQEIHCVSLQHFSDHRGIQSMPGAMRHDATSKVTAGKSKVSHQIQHFMTSTLVGEPQSVL